MLHLQFSPFPFITTERLHLRPLVESDAEEVLLLRSHPVVNKYIQRERAKNLADALQFIERITEQQEQRQSITWAICWKGQQQLIGSVCFWNIDTAREQGELGYSLLPEYFGQRVMTEALKPVLDYGFKHMLLKRIDAYTNKDNVASLRLLKRLGFKRNLEFEEIYENKEELLYNTIHTLLAGQVH